MSKQRPFGFAFLFPFADLIELMINADNLFVFWQFLLYGPIFGSAVEMTAVLLTQTERKWKLLLTVAED